MNNEFIPYEQALALKELRFDEPCFGYYYTLNGKDWKFADDKQYDSLDEFYNIGSMFTISAPLYQQAFRWFREKYRLFGYSYPNDYQKYGYRIVLVKNPENQELVYDWGTKDAPEEAELVCLKKLIELVKNK